jgi:hypothetical protein
MPELRIKEIIIKYYPAVIITEPKVSIKIKFIIFIDAFYIPTESRKD